MCRFLATLSLLCLFGCLLAQKHDAIWLFGTPRLLPTSTNFGGSLLDFRQGSPEVSYFDLALDLDPTAIMCDAEGELVFYSNGCQVHNGMHQLMENGDSINAGARRAAYCDHAYPTVQGLIALPKPGHPGKYGLFHIKLDDDTWFFKDLLYTEIDGEANNGLGRVAFKNQAVFRDTFSPVLSAVRHANGRDWWIISTQRNSDVFFITYYGPEGPGHTYAQTINASSQVYLSSGPSVFSPDGHTFARMNPPVGLQLFSFDRCSGTLYNPILIGFPNDTLGIAVGVAISPNNRFIYVAASKYIYQFDLLSDNIATSRQVVATYDGYLVLDAPALRASFYDLRLAPDGKIYGTAPNSSNVLHVIQEPNLPGVACNVAQHSILLPTLHGFSAPNYPYFRLWDAPGSPCDTLGIDTPTTATTEVGGEAAPWLHVFPNPAVDEVTIQFKAPMSGRLQLFDGTGRLVAGREVAAKTPAVEWSVAGLPAGLYLLRFEERDGRVGYLKLIVQ
jgi:hypothetical protein